MKKHWVYLILLLTFIIFSNSCEKYVTGIDPLIDQVEDELLNDEAEVNFVMIGVLTQFAETHTYCMVIADLLSDELFFTRKVKGSSYGSYEMIDAGIIQLDMSTIEGIETAIGRLRFFSDDLVDRVTNKITFKASQTLKNEALFTGHFFGGLARYYYAAYFGLDKNQGGGVIDGGEFIPSNDMYDLAIAKMITSLDYASDEATKRVVNSLIARFYLYKADYVNAETFALIGMASGDDPYQVLYHESYNSNSYWSNAGIGRMQETVDFRFNDYVTTDPLEANRILITAIKGLDRKTYYRQEKYPLAESPADLMNWQENELMLAELDIRDGGDGLTQINNVRTSHGLADLAAADMNVLIVERDKELFVTGARLVDQRRFDAVYGTWHLDADTWHYLPITDNERNANPNIN